MDFKNVMGEVGTNYQLLNLKNDFFGQLRRRGFFGLSQNQNVAILATFVVFELEATSAPAEPTTWISKMN